MKICRAFALLCLLLLLSGCAAGGVIRGSGAQRVAAEVKKAGNIKNLCTVPGQAAQEIYAMESDAIFSALYGLKEGDCAQMCAYLAETAMNVDEVAIFTCETDAQLDKAKLAVAQRLYTQMQQYQDVSQKLYQRLADAHYGSSGKYYYLIVAEKKSADAAEKRILEFN